ncbi:YitT family protein [Microaerobacter geothermalis]|nr:YitT family protein [Microaerobacter geothermalis]MCF6093358.1 YitT family protein [Microaerobacter geothermalis]
MLKKIKGKNILAILLGTAIFSFGINYFTIANQLAEGGFTGITLLLKYVFNFDPAISNLILNLPLFFIGWKILGRVTMIYTIIGTLSVSLFLWLFSSFQDPIPNDLLLAALYAGVTVGFGLGIVFRFGGTTGGVDIIARLAHKYLGWSIGRTMFLFDFAVITLSLIYLDRERAMYTLVAVFVGARVIDFVQEGAYAAKACMIISDSASEIAEEILHSMERGATMLKGRGGYTGMDREVLYCVISRGELMRLKSIVHSIDPHAFVVVSDAHDVLGEGFTLDGNKMPIER